MFAEKTPTFTLDQSAFHSDLQSLNFELPPELEASQPPEARGLRRDEVQLMVSFYGNDCIKHGHFYHLPEFLEAGDVLVINTSGTMKAAVPATRADGSQFEMHLSTQLPTRFWVIEMRRPAGETSKPFFDLVPEEKFTLPAGGQVTIRRPYCGRGADECTHTRLWTATLDLPETLYQYLDHYGAPIRYSYVNEEWPIDYYQTVYATAYGSAEMPSAGRAFTAELITKLVAKGVHIAPLLLHTGVASLEEHEPPYEEYYRVSEETADVINRARAKGKRIIAVGTTAVRALETVTNEHGWVTAAHGWTDLVITPTRGLHVVDGLLTGLHEPRATHLAMLAAVCGFDHLQLTYKEALERRYLWHEFGDLHLILP
ncbi:MAG: S-adenosylmethionine:tRNA ribosyltransferase-isomerase [Anaerolineales bacterium]|nr:S-adenosylmethionine:tRNA ribosyltransferase-isomerase [Anaerolineales bacterium]